MDPSDRGRHILLVRNGEEMAPFRLPAASGRGATPRNQNWNRSPASISRGLLALVDFPKFRDVRTPEGMP